MLLLRLDLAGVGATAARPSVVTHAHASEMSVRSVPCHAPGEGVALGAFVALLASGAQRRLQQLHALAQRSYLVGCGRDPLPRRPFAQQPQNRIERAHV